MILNASAANGSSSCGRRWTGGLLVVDGMARDTRGTSIGEGR